MGVIGTAINAGVDYITYPISYTVKAFTGKTFGDYVTGNQRPPSTNGFLKNLVSWGTDVVLPGVATFAMGPTAGIAAIGAVLGTKAVTGNSIGDYVTGNTDQNRREVELNHLEKDYIAVQQRMQSRQHSPAQAHGQHVDVPGVGPHRPQAHTPMR